MNRFLTASRLLADLPLTKVHGRQIEFTVRATSYAGHLGCRTDSPQPPGTPNGLVKVSIDDADKRAVDWQRDLTEALMANTRDSPASRRRLSQPSPSK
jgi:hypothetical protein